MTYEVLVSPAATRDLKRIPPESRGRIGAAVLALERDPRAQSKKLVGRDDYRVRVGMYRVIFRVDDRAREVLVTRIKHRREVYGPRRQARSRR